MRAPVPRARGRGRTAPSKSSARTYYYAGRHTTAIRPHGEEGTTDADTCAGADGRRRKKIRATRPGTRFSTRRARISRGNRAPNGIDSNWPWITSDWPGAITNACVCVYMCTTGSPSPLPRVRAAESRRRPNPGDPIALKDEPLLPLYAANANASRNATLPSPERAYKLEPAGKRHVVKISLISYGLKFHCSPGLKYQDIKTMIHLMLQAFRRVLPFFSLLNFFIKWKKMKNALVGSRLQFPSERSNAYTYLTTHFCCAPEISNRRLKPRQLYIHDTDYLVTRSWFRFRGR